MPNNAFKTKQKNQKNLKKNWLFVYQKWQEFWELLPEHSKFWKFLLLLVPFVQSI